MPRNHAGGDLSSSECRLQISRGFGSIGNEQTCKPRGAGVLLHHLETHIGIVILITNKPEALDTAFQRRIRFSVAFPMPDAQLRAKLWRAVIPKQVWPPGLRWTGQHDLAAAILSCNA